MLLIRATLPSSRDLLTKVNNSEKTEPILSEFPYMLLKIGSQILNDFM